MTALSARIRAFPLVSAFYLDCAARAAKRGDREYAVKMIESLMMLADGMIGDMETSMRARKIEAVQS